MADRSICADCGTEIVAGSCPNLECPGRLGDQRARFPGQLTRYRVGAYVEFDVWAGDEHDACIVTTHLGIPDASMTPMLGEPLKMAGRLGRHRVTADAVRLRCLSVHEKPEET